MGIPIPIGAEFKRRRARGAGQRRTNWRGFPGAVRASAIMETGSYKNRGIEQLDGLTAFIEVAEPYI